MARVTVEDCILKIPNRFELVLVCAQRARDVSSGAMITIDRDNDKNPVVALREVADSTISIEELQKSLVMGLQKYVEVQEREEKEGDALAVERELSELDDAFDSIIIAEDGLAVVDEEGDEVVEEEIEEFADGEFDDFNDEDDDEDIGFDDDSSDEF